MDEMLGPYQLNSIVVGDSMKLCDEIPDESVNLIMCDPVWWELDQYEWLGQFASRVLVHGGNMVAQVGTMYRKQAEDLIYPVENLVERPLLIENFTGGFVRMWKHRSLNTYHPYIWVSKGDHDGNVDRERWVHDGVRGKVDKKTHIWGDGTKGMMMWMSAMTVEGDIVVDPFTGGGTVPAIAKMLNRKWLGFEVDEERAIRAVKRLKQTQTPLFVAEVEPVQLPLIDD